MAHNALKINQLLRKPVLATIARSGAAVQQRYLAGAAVSHGVPDYRKIIGTREVVGFGYNGSETYCDSYLCPFPAIRYREETAEIQGLRQKEKGDWKNLSLAEKKVLYRHSFAQTFAEMEAPTGEWKFYLAVVLAGVAAAFGVGIFLRTCIYDPYPESFSIESKEAQLMRMIDLRMNPIEGLASHYDYENKRWKD